MLLGGRAEPGWFEGEGRGRIKGWERCWWGIGCYSIYDAIVRHFTSRLTCRAKGRSSKPGTQIRSESTAPPPPSRSTTNILSPHSLSANPTTLDPLRFAPCTQDDFLASLSHTFLPFLSLFCLLSYLFSLPPSLSLSPHARSPQLEMEKWKASMRVGDNALEPFVPENVEASEWVSEEPYEDPEGFPVLPGKLNEPEAVEWKRPSELGLGELPIWSRIAQSAGEEENGTAGGEGEEVCDPSRAISVRI